MTVSAEPSPTSLWPSPPVPWRYVAAAARVQVVVFAPERGLLISR